VDRAHDAVAAHEERDLAVEVDLDARARAR
jgi:hypothetical protein